MHVRVTRLYVHKEWATFRRARGAASAFPVPQTLLNNAPGSRYSNMDYILFSALLGISLLFVTVLYDIACQYNVNLLTRMEKLPKRLHLDPKVSLNAGIPIWHAGAHKESCQAVNALWYCEGVGKTDGEGIEHIWSHLNPMSWSTKEMGEGARHDALEDKIDHHNFGKNINMGEHSLVCFYFDTDRLP